mmetsp:Transcript_109229/g.189319  ORF Transcript_109229/g.189319 Transcript_109229/m.189319 type:complete len:114 (-) Transcript_109229:282-623(-)
MLGATTLCHARHCMYHSGAPLGTAPGMLGTIPSMLGTIPSMLGTAPSMLGTAGSMLANIHTMPQCSNPQWPNATYHVEASPPLTKTRFQSQFHSSFSSIQFDQFQRAQLKWDI